MLSCWLLAQLHLNLTAGYISQTGLLCSQCKEWLWNHFPKYCLVERWICQHDTRNGQRKNLSPRQESHTWHPKSLFIFIHLSLLSCCMFQETSIDPIPKWDHCKEGLSKANVFDGKQKAKLMPWNFKRGGWVVETKKNHPFLWTMHLGAREGEASDGVKLHNI